MRRSSYLECVQDNLEVLLKRRDRYWSREQEVKDQLITIRNADFLDNSIKKVIEERLHDFDGDKWDLAEELINLFHKKSISLPSSTDIFALLVLYIFYAEKPLDLSII